MIPVYHLFESGKPDLNPGEYAVRMRKPHKVKDLNPRTGRIKKFKRIKWLKTKIPPEQRTLKNLPRDSKKKAKVTFREWLQIQGRKRSLSHNSESWGWGADGKCYGWSHRAIHGFKIGEEITSKVSGFSRLEKPFVIKTDRQCEEVAKRFAESVS